MADFPLKTRLTEAMKAAMRAQDKARLSAIRMIIADIKRIEIDERIDVDDARALIVLDKIAKQRRDSIDQFRSCRAPRPRRQRGFRADRCRRVSTAAAQTPMKSPR